MACNCVSRRSFLHAALASLGLCGCRATPQQSSDGFATLREPVEVPERTLGEHGGAYKFEAWFTAPDGSDKLIDGILLDNDGQIAAYSTYCPHEVCPVKIERNPARLRSVVAPHANLPEHPVLYCTCHYAVFDTRAAGAQLSGPAPRGLYRFRFERDSDLIRVTHVEASIVALFA